MAKKVEKVFNYFKLIDIDSGVVEINKSSGSIEYEPIGVKIYFYHSGTKSSVGPASGYDWDEIMDSQENPFGSYEDLISFLDENTGKYKASGEEAAEDVKEHLIGWQDYADSNTSELNPIVQPNVNGGEVQLTNNNSDTATDGNTNVNSQTTITGVNDLWDTSTNTFVFKNTGIGKNDLFDIRFNPNVNPYIISQDFGIRMDFYDDVAGTGNLVFSLKKSGKTRNDSAGVFDDDFIHIEGYVGESILNGSAVAYFYGSKSFEVENIGHKINILKVSR